MRDLSTLPAREDGSWQVVVETPRGSPYKLTWDPEAGVFRYGRSLPLGTTYPCDWGFVPGTRAADGDPFDALLLHDAPTHPGVVVAVRLLGVVTLTQRAKGRKGGRERNDRVIAVPEEHARWGSLRDLPARTKREIEAFFEAAVRFEDKEVEVLGWKGARVAARLLRRAEVARA
jgi:inorganic pyrophosphatase